MRNHYFILHPDSYEPVISGKNTYIITKTKEIIQVGDYLCLYEWEKNGFTGRRIKMLATDVLTKEKKETKEVCIIIEFKEIIE